jgi:tRNA threonylcarbamoyladenosine biosynthesis protein TsaB
MSIRALAIETSSRIGSVALVEDGNVLAEDTFPHGLAHAAKIISTIDSLCCGLRWSSGDLRELYVSAGPGSFTGLRIGITLAKTLSLATGAALVAVPSVRVLVENAPAEVTTAIVVLDAKRDQIFTASFQRSKEGWTEIEPAHLDSLTAMLARSPRPIHLIGEGIPYHQKFLPQGSDVHLVSEPFWRPQAKIVAKLGWSMARHAHFTDPMSLRPIYIRRPEAEEKLDTNEKRGHS